MKKHVITSLPEYIELVANYKSGTIYRGVSRKNHELRPGVGRIGKTDTEEKRCKALDGEYKLLGNFWEISPAYQECADFTAMAVLAQHHGVPTRFLDWSGNPLVALYFAVRKLDAGSDKENTGIVYAARVPNYTDQWEINYESYVLFEDKKRTDRFREKRADFDPDNIKNFLEYQERILKELGDTIFLFSPVCISHRMHAQASMLTFHPDPFTPMTEEVVAEIHIPPEHKRKIKKMLARCGVHEFALFPGLDGLGTWLTDTYWPKFGQG